MSSLQSVSSHLLANAGGFDFSVFLNTLVYAALGLVLFALVFLIITKMTPFSIRKEIEDDQNTALAILIGSVMIALAIILGSSISG